MSSSFHFNYIEEGWAEHVYDAFLAKTPIWLPVICINVSVFKKYEYQDSAIMRKAE